MFSKLSRMAVGMLAAGALSAAAADLSVNPPAALGGQAPAPKVAANVESVIKQRLEQARPDLKVSSVRVSPIAGLYLVQVGGGTVLVNADATKIVLGEILNVNPNGFTRWEDPQVLAERKNLLATVKEKDAITFKPEQTKKVVYVFTDVDCGYCRKLNNEMADYLKLGIEIRYLAFPRAGIPSPSADKLITAWCSKDRAKALTLLKRDEEVPQLTCDNPVAAQFELGGRVGVNGTPALWLPNGEIRPGYMPAEALAKELGIL